MVIELLIVIMAAGGILLFIRYQYLKQFPIKNLKDINSSFAALVKRQNKIIEHINEIKELNMEQAKFSKSTEKAFKEADKILSDLNNRIKDLEND